MKIKQLIINFFIICFFSMSFAQEFEIPMNVSDGNTGTEITFGTNADGSNGYDSGLDQYAPPKPPSGSFDARFTWNSEDYIVDIRDNSKVDKEYIMQYQPSSGAGPIIVSWDSTGLSTLGEFFIVSENGQADTIDMTETDHLDTSTHWDFEEELRILYSPLDPSGLFDDKSPKNPKDYLVVDIYPNPFNPRTTIKYSLPNHSEIKIQIYNAQGKYVNTLMDGYQNAGEHFLEFNGHNMASGSYFIQVSTSNHREVKKVILIK